MKKLLKILILKFKLVENILWDWEINTVILSLNISRINYEKAKMEQTSIYKNCTRYYYWSNYYIFLILKRL